MRLRDAQMSEASLISLFEFNEPSGNFADSKGSVVGTAGIGHTYQEPAIPYDDPGYSLKFDRTIPSVIKFGDVFDFTGTAPFAFEFTIKPTTFDSHNVWLFGKGNPNTGGAYWCDYWGHQSQYVRDGNCVRFRRWNSSGVASAEIYAANPYRPDEENHVVISFTGTILECVVNGKMLTISGTDTVSLPNTTEQFCIGGLDYTGSGGAAQGHGGWLGNFAVYNAAMPEARAIEHARAFFNPRKRVPMVHHNRDWLLDDHMRAANCAGDRRAPEGSYGCWYERSNYVPNHNAVTDTSGWGGSTGVVVTRDTTEFAFGQTSFKVDTDGTGASRGLERTTLIATPPAIGNGAVFSAWCKVPNGQGMELGFECRNSGGGVINEFWQSFTGTGNWQRVEASGIVPALTTQFKPMVLTTSAANINFYVGGLQLEDTGTPTGTGRLWSSPYMGIAQSSRVGSRLLLYDADLPINFYNQGWMAFRWRQGFTGNLSDGENMGFLQRGNAAERHTIYGNGYQNMYVYIASAGGSGDAYALGTFTSPPVTKDVKYTALGGWTPTTILSAVDGAALTITSGRAHPAVKTAVANTVYADVFGGYQWFDMRPQSDCFWAIFGSGVPTDADSTALAALSDNPTKAQVRSVLSKASAPALLYNEGNLFAEVITPQTTFVSRRRMVQR